MRLLPFLILLLLPFNVFAADIEDCESGTVECSCTPSTTYEVEGEADFTTTKDCEDACLAIFEQDSSITGYSIQCTVDGALTTIAQGGLYDEDSTTESSEPSSYLLPDLSVDIPGLEFTEPTGEDGIIKSNILGEYIEAGYTWALGAASLLAIVMLMLGGLEYMLARGKQASIGKAKKRIKNAVTGIILLFAAYSIAFMVDPATTTFDTLNISYIDPEEYIESSGDIFGNIDTSLSYTAPEVLCSTEYSVQEIIDSMVGNVTYRLGGKGQGPDYEYETKTSPTGEEYSTFCPDDTLCLDCSGFVGYVATCADLSDEGESGGTAGIFTEADSEKITSCDSDGTINGTALEIGDLVGWSTTLAPDESYGHVFMYAGDGQVADSAGSGREPGEAVSKKSISWVCESYGEHLYVRRRQ